MIGHERTAERDAMVATQLVLRGIADERVLDAMRIVRRHRFVQPDVVEQAYRDSPLPIMCDQTISQPYIVALMTEALQVAPGMRVLEIGTGSGYQAAVLAALGASVWTVERHAALAERAARVLAAEGLADRVALRVGDGFAGWPEAAPFDRIIVTAAPEAVPPTLLAQLRPGGRLVIPVGIGEQSLQVLVKDEAGRVHVERGIAVRFVPMLPGLGGDGR
jgi:protein-L-isoaspartate(D-aspartate) O-methyltransferase